MSIEFLPLDPYTQRVACQPKGHNS